MTLLGKVFLAILLFCIWGILVAIFFWGLSDGKKVLGRNCNVETPLKALVVFANIIAFITIIGFAILSVWLVGWAK